jgi:uncharacterized protein YndB with AHSA1/START domain
VLQKSLRVAAPRELVFSLLTDADGIGRWLTPVAYLEPAPGGEVELAFLNQNGTLSVIRGRVTEFAPPERVAYTWHNPAWPFPPLRVRFSLRPVPGGTEVLLVQWGFAGQPLERAVHDEGWEHYLGRLAVAAEGALTPGAPGEADRHGTTL